MTDFVEDDDDTDIEDLFPFALGEQELIGQLNTAVRKRILTISPASLQDIAPFLYALERLPYATSNVSLDLAIMDRVGENLSYVSVEVDDQSFRLSTGGSEYSPDVGSDSYSTTVFRVEIGGCRYGTTQDFTEWLDAFVSASGTIEIQGYGASDLTEPAPEDGWDRLAKYRESHGDDVDGW